MWEESLLKLVTSDVPAGQLGKGRGRRRVLAQEFYWKTLEASAASSATSPGAEILSGEVGDGSLVWSHLARLLLLRYRAANPRNCPVSLAILYVAFCPCLSVSISATLGTRLPGPRALGCHIYQGCLGFRVSMRKRVEHVFLTPNHWGIPQQYYPCQVSLLHRVTLRVVEAALHRLLGDLGSRAPPQRAVCSQAAPFALLGLTRLICATGFWTG